MEVFAAVIACVMLLYVDAACPPTWRSHRSSCYYVSLTQRASWPDAATFCRVFGGYLVVINNAEEDNYVRGLATLTGSDVVWIGATDIQEEGVWRSSNSQKQLEYIGTWGPGQPNKDGNCMHLWGAAKYLWADFVCIHPDFFICERPAI